jgi:hypothetical protein
VARAAKTDQIAVATSSLLLPLHMTEENPDKVRVRRQPPVPVTFAVFLASVVGFMVVVAGLFALMRYLGRH